MNKQDIINHIKINCPHGDELSFMLQHNPDEWQDFETLMQEILNFDEYDDLVLFLNIRNKSFDSYTCIKYSQAFSHIGEEYLSEIMTKVEFLIKFNYDLNYNFHSK